MDSSRLTAEQVLAMAKVVRRQLRYWGGLRRRMDEVAFTPTDPLYVTAQRAYEAVYAMSVELHYLRCARGTVGK